MASDHNTDELFASLGGSLMKDIWADLQIGEGSGEDDDIGWSLEQLEKELTAHLGDEQPTDGALDPTFLSAASLVVSSQQEQAHLQQPYSTPVATTTSAADAWSQSLEKFTALSLEQDFLAADSARKGTSTAAMPDPSILSAAEDYNVAETPQLASPPAGWTAPARPPGMPSPSPKTKRTVAARPQAGMPTLPEIPPKRTMPKTPQNSLATDEDDMSSPIVTAPPVELPKGQVQQQPPPAAAWQQVTPVAVPAWKGPPPPQLAPPAATMLMPTPVAPVFCQSHPFAPPIPATALESALMKARDISYVLHSMLKPVLIAGTSRNDYDIMLLQKRQGQGVSKDRKKKGYSMEKEMASRQEKAKEWHEKHSTLGHVAKADVSRPRALLATPTLKKKEEQDESSKERAALWKARVYVDQCYQAYHSVVECWQAAPPGTVPKAVQPHLLKLLKCLGIKKLASPVGSYEFASPDALGNLLKLPKGQTLLARILEQALLPPNAVQTLMPAVLQVTLSNPKQQPQSPADMRLFRALSSVVTGLPNIQGSCLLECVEKVKEAGATQALASTARMECVHALLRRGQVLSQQGSDASFQEEWTKTEEEFMAMLG